MERKTVGERIREAREEKGISSYELAKRAGLKPSRLLQGKEEQEMEG